MIFLLYATHSVCCRAILVLLTFFSFTYTAGYISSRFYVVRLNYRYLFTPAKEMFYQKSLSTIFSRLM